VLNDLKKDNGNKDLSLNLYAEALIPTLFGEFLVSVYRDQDGEENAILISKGLFAGADPFVRVHSECFTGEALGSLKCDCREQLSLALIEIERLGCGAVVYLRQEGRGIGLGNKIKAYHLQNLGANTVEANHQLGFATDLRSFEAAALVIRDRGISSVKLNTNNPDKVAGLERGGVRISERVPSLAALNEHNEGYLKTKMLMLGHHLDSLFAVDDKE
jgi:GTP cyclohydrolase II